MNYFSISIQDQQRVLAEYKQLKERRVSSLATGMVYKTAAALSSVALGLVFCALGAGVLSSFPFILAAGLVMSSVWSAIRIDCIDEEIPHPVFEMEAF